MPFAIDAKTASVKTTPSNYPAPFAARMIGRIKRPLGDVFGIKNFGVNLTSLGPGTASSLFHSHSRQDEFVYILEGETTLVTSQGEIKLCPGMCAGFPSKHGDAHMLINRSEKFCTYLEIGDRTLGDSITYPLDDISAIAGQDGIWRFVHKNGTAYDE